MEWLYIRNFRKKELKQASLNVKTIKKLFESVKKLLKKLYFSRLILKYQNNIKLKMPQEKIKVKNQVSLKNHT